MVERRFRPAVAATVLLVVWAGADDAAAQDMDLTDLVEDGYWLPYNSGLRRLGIEAIAVDPERPSRLYAGAEGFIYRSLDGGERWEIVQRVAQGGRSQSRREVASTLDIDGLTDELLDRVEEVLADLELQLFEDVADETNEVDAALAVEAARDDLLLEAVAIVRDEADSVVREEARLIVPPQERPDNLFNQILIDPRDTSRVYAASGRGVLGSTDYGASWTPLYRGVGGGQRQVSSLVVTTEAIVLGTASGIVRSLDGGLTWSRVSGPPASNSVSFIAGAPSRSRRLYAVSEGRIHRSDDHGETWSQQAVPVGLRADEIVNIAVHPLDPDLLYLATANGVIVSRDAGRTFDATSFIGLRERRVAWVACAGDDLLAGTLDGFYVSVNEGQSWTELNSGLSASRIRQIGLSDEPAVWVTTNAGIFKLVPRRQLVPSEESARSARASWAADPALALTIDAALAYAGYDAIDEAAWNRRIYLRRFLPRAQIRWEFRREQDVSRDFVPVFDSQPRLTARDFEGSVDDEFRILFLWDIADILIDSEELSQRTTVDRLVDRRRDLIRDVIRTYQSRRDLLTRMAEAGPTTTLRHALDQLEADELAARLDAFTGGFFSAYRRTGASR